MWQNNELHCRWLHNRADREKICNEQPVALAACPETCQGKCNGGFTCANPQGKTDEGENNPTVMTPIQTTSTPTLTPVAPLLVTPTITPCGDCATEASFIMWQNKELNCKWLHGRDDREKLCNEQPVAKNACPETCQGKCSGGFTCTNNPKNRQRKLSGTAEKKVIHNAPCTDPLTKQFILDGTKRTCKWLATVGIAKTDDIVIVFQW